MDDRIMQFRVGVVVLAVGLIAGFLILLFGHFPSLAQRVTRSTSISLKRLASKRRHPSARAAS